MGVPVITPDGQRVEVPEADAAAGFRDGRFHLDGGSRYRVRLPDGGVGDVPADSVQDVLERGGGFATPEEFAHAEREAQYGSTGQMVAAGAEGAARGLTFGLSDEAAGALGADTASMEARREVNPGAAMTGEVAGALLPLAIPGVGEAEGAGLLARGADLAGEGVRAAGALPRAAAAVGDVAAGLGRGAADVLGLGGEGLVSRVARAGIEEGARGAAEGALYGAGGAATEDALGDHDLTADQLLSHVGMGALLGGAATGLLGAGGRLAREGSVAVAERLAPDFARAMSDGSLLAHLAEERAFKSLGGGKRFTREALARDGGIEGVGRTLLDRGIVTGDATLETIGDRLETAVPQAGGEVGAVLRRIDAAGVAPDTAGIRSEVEALTRRLRDVPLGSGERLAQQVENEMAPMLERFSQTDAPITLEQLHAWRAALDDVAYRGTSAVAPSPINAELQRIRGSMESAIESAVESASPAELAAYKAAKKAYGGLRLAQRIVEDRLAANAANRTFSLSDHILGSAGAVLVGGVHPASLAMGFITGAVNKFFRERGNQVLAAGLDRVAQIRALQRVHTAAAANIRTSVRTFLRGAGSAARAAPSATSVRAYEAAVEQVRDRDPGTMQTRLAEGTDGVRRVAPKVGAALMLRGARAQSYLASRIPSSDRMRLDTLQPHLALPRVPETDRASFLRSVRAVEDPASVLEDLRAGRVTREGVDALRTVYPSMYRELVAEVQRQVSAKGTEIPYATRLRLGALTGVVTDPTLAPDFIAREQLIHAQTAAAVADEQRQQQQRMASPSGLGMAAATDAQRLDGKDEAA